MGKIKVALLVDEFFSNSIPFCKGKGGYGMLARNYITEYIPDDTIEIDTIIGFNNKNELLSIIRKLFNYDKTIRSIADQYDVFLSIEFQSIPHAVLRFAGKKQKLILWIQDPRPKSDWDELDSMSIIKQNGFKPNKRAQKIVNRFYYQKRLIAISQGKYLIEKARELYTLPSQFQAELVPNPINIPTISEAEIRRKKNSVVALGRLDSVKRPWIIGEIAKKLPEYDFYFLGQYHEEKVKSLMEPYLHLENCHFKGHIEGDEKDKMLREAKILINTSIHEAIPISFLEAISYGTLIVSNRNPDDLTSQFGIYTGQINGDGFDSVDTFVKAIRQIIENDDMRISIAKKGIEYVKTHHAIDKFVVNLRQIIKYAAAGGQKS